MSILAASTGDLSLLPFEERLRSARLRTTPPDILSLLAEDDDKDVRWYVAANRNTPRETLKILSGDNDAGVRRLARIKLRA